MILSGILTVSFLYLFNVTECLSVKPCLLSLHPNLQEAVTKGLLVQPEGRPNVYVLGTVHIGSKSAEEAQVLIETVQPNTVILEIPPSRQGRITRQRNGARESTTDKIAFEPSSTSGQVQSKSTSFGKALQTIPPLAISGYENGGFSGLIFSTFIVGGSLIKQSLSSKEENDKLPRRNEFLAVTDVVENINTLRSKAGNENAIQVIAADLELEELIQSIVESMSILKWFELGVHILEETIGTKEVDPVRRSRNESVVEWEQRRRNIDTARASREHGEGVAGGEFGRVLVNKRDERFISACLKALDEGNEGMDVLVCVVGLVHLDGVCEGLAK
jgi:hypothetical protein